MKELFSIGQVGRLFHVNIRTLRFYDEIGILKPERTDPQTGYRYYSTRQFERLNTIKYLRTLGMPLAKIEQFLESRDTDVLLRLLADQKEETRRQMEELERIQRKIENRIGQIADAVNSPREEIREVHFGRRPAAMLKREISVQEDLEFPIRELDRQNELEPVMFLGKVGVSVAEENLVRRKFSAFSAVFVLVEREDQFSGELQELPESDYAAIRFSGTHSQSGRFYEKLLRYIEEKNYRLNGDSVEITLIDYGLTNDLDKFVTELQVPFVKKDEKKRA